MADTSKTTEQGQQPKQLQQEERLVLIRAVRSLRSVVN